MKIEVLEDSLKDADPETGALYNLGLGDRVTVSDALGKHWCDHGWAKDLEGGHPTGTRKVEGVTVDVHSVKHTQKSKTK